jgi:selenocysteine lyase/cysteine desulfurase
MVFSSAGTLIVCIFCVDSTRTIFRQSWLITYSFHRSLADVFLMSNYKWMNAGLGHGIMAIRKDFFSKNLPKIGGYGSFILKGHDWTYEPSMLSYEHGHHNMGGLLMLREAILLKEHLGMENIAQHVSTLLSKLISVLQSHDFRCLGAENLPNRAGILCLAASKKVIQYLDRHQIMYKARLGTIRFGIHFHNTRKDIEGIASAIIGSLTK